MLSISPGHSSKYLTDAVATGRENYYTGAVTEGEPPGRWYGAGAEHLGLVGLVDAQDMQGLYERYLDPRDPQFRCPEAWDEVSTLGHAGRRYATEEKIYARLLKAEPHADAERRDALRVEASKSVRKNVSFLDVTFSPAKSITVVHTAFEAQEVAARNGGRLEEATAWSEHRQAVEDAIWAGNKAGLDYLAEHAGFARVGHHGGAAGQWVDAHDWVVASFFQHDSREHDPQLHIHNAILNRVQGPDGVWRTLDSRAIHKFRGAAGAIAERTMEEHLARSLGLVAVTRPDGKARELIGVPAAANDLFSTRTRAITPRQAAMFAQFEARFGREPNRLERSRLANRATLVTRRAKSHTGQPREDWLEQWDIALRGEIAGGLAQVAHDVLELRGQAPQPVAWSPVEVIQTALAAVQAKMAAWTEPDLAREISNALPDHLGLPDGARIGQLVDTLTGRAVELALLLDAQRPGEQVLPDGLRRADGESVYQAPGGRRYATPEHVHTERLLLGATADRTAAALDSIAVARFFDQLRAAGVELGEDQAAAVRGILCSGARVETLIGPAGTGKSFVVGALTRAWQSPELWPGEGEAGRVFGLATSQIAADVLAGEGLSATNTARWLATQARLAQGGTAAGDEAWRLRAGDLVVVDESSMADTAALAVVHTHIAEAGAKLLLVGDHRQLAAVGAGGALDLLDRAGGSYELVEARRFAHQWEQTASLRLRAGDTAVLGDYHKHGRIIDGGTHDQAQTLARQRWLGAHLTGSEALLVVDDNETAAQLNASIRADLVRLGHVTEHGLLLGREGTYAGVGDVVSARRLAWELTGYQSNRSVPTTRQRYRVQATRADGSMVVAPILGRTGGAEALGEPITLPASYVADDLSLGYAGTVHAAQGMTVDTCIDIATANTPATALYAGSTRGRENNTILVVTQSAPGRDSTAGEIAQTPRQDPRAVLTGILETRDQRHQQSATAHAEDSTDRTARVATPAELFADEAARICTARTATWLDHLTDAGQLSAAERTRLAAEDGAATLGRILRRAELAGHDPQAVLVAAIEERALDGARNLSNVLYTRINDRRHLHPRGYRYADWIPATDDPAVARYLTALAEAADSRRAELGREVEKDQPAWAVEALGPVPDDVGERQVWRERAASVAAHRELTAHTDLHTAIGPSPGPGQAEAHASWQAAWRALGRPEADRDEAQLSDGQLRMRVRAYEREQPWAPRYVANELAATMQTAEHYRARSTTAAAEATATTDPARREDLRQEAADTELLADYLDGQIEQLKVLDDQRAAWFVHTAPTRVAAERAQDELTARHAGDPAVDDRVTADEWLTADQEAVREDDQHRDITETDLIDTTAAEPPTPTDKRREPEYDLRQVAEAEPVQVGEELVRIPSADETSAAILRAQRALTEIAFRTAADAAREAEEARAAQISRWHHDDHGHDHGAEQDSGIDLRY